MSTTTSIEWTDVTWNPIRGCQLVSPGCTNCYAMKQAHRFSGEGMPYEGLTKLGDRGPVWTGEVRLVPELLNDPLKWRKPRRVFVNSMSDLFHEAVPDEFILQVFAVMAICPQHTFQILTKRPQRMLQFFTQPYLTSPGHDERVRGAVLRRAGCGQRVPVWPLPNVWLGVSVEDQPRADERIPLLVETPAAVRFLSCEPLIAPVNLRPQTGVRKIPDGEGGVDYLDDYADWLYKIDWVIVGGESGPHARPMQPDWARSLRDQCQAAGAKFFMKQMAKREPIPSDLFIREYPNAIDSTCR